MKRGILLLLSAEFCFALATVFAKFITNASDIPSIEITFFRVSAGTLIALFYMINTGVSFRPNKPKLVIWRAVLSFLALIAFFYAVHLTSVTKANMLNMTYPVFIFMLAPVFGIQRIHAISVIFLVMAMAGIYLVIQPDFSTINLGDVIGLLSGIVAAFAIIVLAMARTHDSTVLIVFYLMAIGTLCNGILMFPFFVMPDRREFILLLASGITGAVGQVLLTMGYKYVNARTGSMISTSRILFAAILGTFFFGDQLSVHIVAGGLLIILAVIGISALQRNHGRQEAGDPQGN